MRKAKIGDRWVGDGYPTFISFEPGATHTGLESAKKLAKAAADAGADAVKFQTTYADELISSRESSDKVKFKTPEGWKKSSVYEDMKRRELSPEEWRELKAYCDDLGLLFISCPSGPRTIELLGEMDIAAIKVVKSDINNRYLIKLIAEQGKPVIFDARQKFEDVEIGCRICEDAGIKDIVIMHCPSGYPAEYAGIHLNVIPRIKEIFDYPVAYSDHSVGYYMNFVALGMGANFIEKTITLDKRAKAAEHFMSLEPDEAKEFVKKIREAEEALGDSRVIFKQRVKKDHLRSVMIAQDIDKGQTITIDDLTFKRPGYYFPVNRYEEVVGKKATRDLKAGEFISEDDFE